ncbi:MAG: hypothetical protein ACP5NS_04455 [Candidatus Pacearchaeota archaeon]
MREDIVGMLKNAIERGGRPDKVAESLIASGYNALEVQQALSFVTGGTLSSLSAPQQAYSQPRTVSPPQSSQPPPLKQPYSPYPQNFQPPQQMVKPLPVYKEQPTEGTARVIILVVVLLLLVGGLISTIIFKESILKILG